MSASKIAFIRPEYMPLSIARSLWKGKFIILLVWVAATAISYHYVSLMPPAYFAEAMVLVEGQKIPSSYVSSVVNTSVQDRLATINRRILSTDKLVKVLEDVGLYHDKGDGRIPRGLVGMLKGNIRILLEKGWSNDQTGGFRVHYEGSDPKMVAAIANRVANLYVEENLRTRETQVEGTVEFLDSQLAEAKKKLDEQETALSRYKAQHNGELPQQENSLINALSRLQMELQANNDGLNRAQENKVMLENNLHVAESAVTALARAVETGTPAPPELVSTIEPAAGPKAPPPPPRKSELMESELAQLRLRYSEQHPDIKRLKQEIAAAKEAEEMEDRQAVARAQATPAPVAPSKAVTKAPSTPKMRPASVNDVMELNKARQRVTDLKVQIASTEKELQTRTADQERIRRDMALTQARVDRLPFREQEMGELMRDYDMTKATYQSLLGNKVKADMGTDLERLQKGERFMLLEPATVPTTPFKPNRKLLYGLGCCFGLALGAALAFVNELRRNVLLGQWELVGTPILGTLPNITIERGTGQTVRSFWRPNFG